MRQGEQAWLLSTDGGNHEFARMFWARDPNKPDEPARYRVGPAGAARLGRYDLLSVDVTAQGAHLEWAGGRHSFIPADWFQFTWST